MKDISERLKHIRWILADCDGVLTDGGVYYGAQGEALKRFDIRDGMGVERLRDLAGIETGIVTGEVSPSVVKRAEKLRIHECLLGVKDKAAAVRDFLLRHDLQAEYLAYIGDDANDLPAFALAGVSACPSDAFGFVKSAADIVLDRCGGHGAFREFAELVIRIKTL